MARSVLFSPLLLLFATAQWPDCDLSDLEVKRANDVNFLNITWRRGAKEHIFYVLYPTTAPPVNAKGFPLLVFMHGGTAKYEM